MDCLAHLPSDPTFTCCSTTQLLLQRLATLVSIQYLHLNLCHLHLTRKIVSASQPSLISDVLRALSSLLLLLSLLAQLNLQPVKLVRSCLHLNRNLAHFKLPSLAASMVASLLPCPLIDFIIPSATLLLIPLAAFCNVDCCSPQPLCAYSLNIFSLNLACHLN